VVGTLSTRLSRSASVSESIIVLEHHQERLHLTLSQQETLEGVQGSSW